MFTSDAARLEERVCFLEQASSLPDHMVLHGINYRFYLPMNLAVFVYPALFFIICLSLPLKAANPQFPVSIHQNKKELFDKFRKSLETWQRYKEKCGEDYSYVSYRQSHTSLREKTLIKVKKGKILKRSFERSRPDFEEVRHQTKWVENGEEQIGMHPEGVKPLTIDQLYAICENEILDKNTEAESMIEKKEYYFIRLVTESRDLLYECLAWNNDCRGDCWKGVRLHEIRFDACGGKEQNEEPAETR